MAIDRFSKKLVCPVCGREGVVDLWEKDGAEYLFRDQATRVESLPEGFREVDGRSSIGKIDFQCIDHPVSAVA